MKAGDAFVDKGKAEESPNDLADPRLAAKERAKRRNQMTADLFSEHNRGIGNDISAAEVTYEVMFSFTSVPYPVISSYAYANPWFTFIFVPRELGNFA